MKLHGVCVLEQSWNKTLQGCGPPGTEFDTPAIEILVTAFMCHKCLFQKIMQNEVQC